MTLPTCENFSQNTKKKNLECTYVVNNITNLKNKDNEKTRKLNQKKIKHDSGTDD
jgi:hypothetical protein